VVYVSTYKAVIILSALLASLLEMTFVVCLYVEAPTVLNVLIDCMIKALIMPSLSLMRGYVALYMLVCLSVDYMISVSIYRDLFGIHVLQIYEYRT